MTTVTPLTRFTGSVAFIGDFMEQVTPEYVAVLFDESLSKSFRTDIYPEYKANRDPAPPELKRQFGQCRRFVRAMGLLEHASPTLRSGRPDRYARRTRPTPGAAVDDRQSRQRPHTTPDQRRRVLGFRGQRQIGLRQIPGSFGVWPEQIADFLALAGDAVDNIKGVPGVGKKTAEGLLKHFGSLEDIYNNLDRVHEVNVRGAKTLATKLETHRDDAMLARRLTGIACDAPFEDAETAMQPSAPKLGEINALFDEAGIGMALRRQAERVSDIYRH